MRVMTLNMRADLWDLSHRVTEIGRFIRDNADVALLQEVPGGLITFGDKSRTIARHAQRTYESIKVTSLGWFYQVRQAVLCRHPASFATGHIVHAEPGCWTRKMQVVRYPQFTVVNVHLGYEGNVLEQWDRFLNILHTYRDHKIILGGDFNTESVYLWDYLYEMDYRRAASPQTYGHKWIDHLWFKGFDKVGVADTCLEDVSDHKGIIVEVS